jgi:hypothetical protein
MENTMSKNQIRRRACSSTDVSVRKESLLHMLEGDSGAHKFLGSLEVNKWKITSFDPIQRTACVEYDNGDGIIKSFTFVIPVPGVKFHSSSDESYTLS